jgi:hypothetical protein
MIMIFQNIPSQIRTPSWSSKSSRTSRSVTIRSRLRHHGDESDTTSLSACSQSSRSFQAIPQPVTRTKVASTNSSTNSKPVIPSGENRLNDTSHQHQRQSQSSYHQQPQQQQPMTQKLKVEQQQHCADFLEPSQQYSMVPMESVVEAAYSGSTDASLIAPLQANEVTISYGFTAFKVTITMVSYDNVRNIV